MSIVDNYEGFIFDLDGTLYLDETLIPNAEKVINEIKHLNKKIVCLSNKTTGTTLDYFQLLHSKGMNIEFNEILNSTIIIKNYLLHYHANDIFYAIGETKFINELCTSGLSYSDNPAEIDILIVTLDRTLDYTKLEIGAKSLDRGARFYAANIDNTCPVVGGEILDAGATISALEKRTNRTLEINFGKPSVHMLNSALNLINVPKEKCLIIGDRLDTDITMGINHGIDTALVSTGVSNSNSSIQNIQPTYNIHSVADILK